MKMENKRTKDKVADAATALFFQKGFHATSVRDIAQAAMVNVSLIHYYFKSKQGLLEYTIIHYYETYLTYIDSQITQVAGKGETEQLKTLIEAMMRYKIERYELTYFIQRELSIDSTFVRELTVTYLAKEEHLLKRLFLENPHIKQQKNKHILYLQLKGMIVTPFQMKNEWEKHRLDAPSIDYFIRTYVEMVYLWLDYLFSNKNQYEKV